MREIVDLALWEGGIRGVIGDSRGGDGDEEDREIARQGSGYGHNGGGKPADEERKKERAAEEALLYQRVPERFREVGVGVVIPSK